MTEKSRSQGKRSVGLSSDNKVAKYTYLFDVEEVERKIEIM